MKRLNFFKIIKGFALIAIVFFATNCQERIWDNPYDSKSENYISPPQFGSVNDIEGNTYKTVQIGSQLWMAENLKTTKYNDGTQIPNVTDNTQWKGLTSGAYCWFNNDLSNKAKYGALYNWYAINTGKLCPSGWHVSSSDDWRILSNFLGSNGLNSESLAAPISWNSLFNGSDWVNFPTLYRNITGFGAIASGTRSYYGNNFEFGFIYLGMEGVWWSPITINPVIQNDDMYRVHVIQSGYDEIIELWNYKIEGNSVRCIKD